MPEQPVVVEVVYAGACRVTRTLSMPAGSTALEAVVASGIVAALPAGAFDPDRLGIFARRVPPGHVLRDGDRVEIYRPLVIDPKDARRRRARGAA